MRKAAQILASLPLFEGAPTKDFNLYTEYQRGFPRFRYLHQQRINVTLFSDEFLHLDPLDHSVIPPSAHRQGIQYSKEFEDYFPVEEIASLPIPRLRPFFAGACRRYQEHHDDISGMAVEQLIDGMDLNEAWCRQTISEDRPQDLEFALARLRGKASRTADSFLNKYTCFIADEAEARVVHGIPGRDLMMSESSIVTSVSLTLP